MKTDGLWMCKKCHLWMIGQVDHLCISKEEREANFERAVAEGLAEADGCSSADEHQRLADAAAALVEAIAPWWPGGDLPTVLAAMAEAVSEATSEEPDDCPDCRGEAVHIDVLADHAGCASHDILDDGGARCTCGAILQACAACRGSGRINRSVRDIDLADALLEAIERTR